MSRLDKWKNSRRWVGGLLIIFVVLTLFGWRTYPRVWADEGWISEVAWTKAQGAPLGNPSHGSYARYEDRVYWMPPLYFLVLSGVLKMGADPLEGGRWLSVLVALATAGLLLIWGKKVLLESSGNPAQERSPPRELWLAALVLAFALDPMLWKVHRSIRFESLLALWSIAGLCLVWSPETRWRGFLGGAAAGLALLTHPNGIFALVAGGGILVLRRGPGRRWIRDLAGYLGMAVLVCLPFVLYLLGDAPNRFSNFLSQNSPHLTGPSLDPLGAWVGEFRRYRSYFPWPYLTFPLSMWAACLALGLRFRAPRALLWTLLIWMGGLAFLPNKTEVYLTAVSPILYLLGAWVGARSRSQTLALLLGGVWLLNLAIADTGLLLRDRGCNYREWSDNIARSIPDQASVAGTFVAWFSVHDHPYMEFHRRRAGDLLDAKPDYVVWGGNHLSDPIFDRLRREFGPFLLQYGDVVHVSETNCYGTLTVYRPRWNEVDPELGQDWERYGSDTP